MSFKIRDAAGNEREVAGREGPRGKPGPPGQKGDTGDDGNPIGTVISFLGLTAPEGYLVCDGATYSMADYPALSAFIAAQFGSANHFGGDGTATFAVPDMRNLFLRGYHGAAEDQLSGEIGARQEGTEIPVFGASRVEESSQALWTYATSMGYTNINNADSFVGGMAAKSVYVKGILDAGSSGASHAKIRPTNVAVLYCIKAAKTVPAAPVTQTVGSNPTLLHNGYFLRPVNQRRVSGTITEPGYFIDRWKLISGSVTIGADGLTLNGTIAQILEYSIGSPVIASVLRSDGLFPAEYDDESKTFSITATGQTIIAAKLELGSVQTIAHQDEYGAWVLNDPPPDYATELAKCQRFAFNTGETCKIRIAQKFAAEKKVWVTVPLPVSMRAVPTITSIGNGSVLYSVDGSSNSVFKSYGVEALSSSGVTIWIESDLVTSNFDGFVLLKNVGFSADIQ